MTLWEELINSINPYIGWEININTLKVVEEKINSVISKYDLDPNFKLYVKLGDNNNLQIIPRIGVTEELLDTNIFNIPLKDGK